MTKSRSTSKFFNGPLYARMSDDLHLGGMSERTHAGYLRAVRQLADYSKTSPEKITEDGLRRYFLYLKNEKKFAYGSLRVAFSGIKFFYTRTCKRNWQTLAQMKLQNVKTLPEVLTIRVDQSLYFANTKYLEDMVLGMVADQPAVKYLILLGTAINFIDASALETLESLDDELQSAGVELHLAAIKGPVLDRLRKIGFVEMIGEDHVHFSNHDALITLGFVNPADRNDVPPAEAARLAQKPYTA